ncbi:hypothetical protein TruAng_005346 [Truncatella angustata]|nr:hypothetical protein TruAng_005346 [Truncatella angustata]
MQHIPTKDQNSIPMPTAWPGYTNMHSEISIPRTSTSQLSRPWSHPPSYSKQPGDMELSDWASSSNSLEWSSPSHAEARSVISTPPPFRATTHLQIQSQGKALHSLPTPTSPTPLPVFTLTPDGRLDRLIYLSVRPKRSSGSCFLARGDDEQETPLTATTYRFGPGRPPAVRLGNPDDPGGPQEEFEVRSLGLFTRSQSMRTSLGTFEWRYAGSGARAVESADNVLVLERGASTGHLGGTGESCTRVAQLVRNRAFRTPGTCRATAGNGGRLMLDLSGFDEKERERVQVLVVTTAIVMLKKEVDRRRRDGPYSLWWL